MTAPGAGWLVISRDPLRQRTLLRQFLVATVDPEHAIRIARALVGSGPEVVARSMIDASHLQHRGMQPDGIVELGGSRFASASQARPRRVPDSTERE
jgi:hypothetical protein